MDLSTKSRENISFMIKKMKKKLMLVNESIIQPEHFSTDQYEDIRAIYEHVMARETLSVGEMEAVLAELGQLRKKSSK